MKNEMDYENIDWDAEEQRVARAFGVSKECHFQEYLIDRPVENGLGSSFRLVWKDGSEEGALPEREGALFWCMYLKKSGGKIFALEWLDEYDQVLIEIEKNGKVYVQRENWELARFLTKALFHLDLLTSEVEAAMEISVSAHEKLEWTREYEERYGL